MIWVAGRIVRDEELTISVLDRTFEHGLGLFETLRTWEGRATLLARHLTRLARSAAELGIPLDGVVMPDEFAVADLLSANGVEGNALVRITLTGGLSDARGASLWMRSAPLPPPPRKEGALVHVGTWRVVRDDPLARHKSLNYWARRVAYESARKIGFDETLSMTLGECVWEGSRTNLFVVDHDELVTPALDGPFVPGIMRGFVLEAAAELPLGTREVEELKLERVFRADEVFLTNSVRGIIPVRMIQSSPWRSPLKALQQTTGEKKWDAPGPWTQRLALLVADRLKLQGGRPA